MWVGAVLLTGAGGYLLFVVWECIKVRRRKKGDT